MHKCREWSFFGTKKVPPAHSVDAGSITSPWRILSITLIENCLPVSPAAYGVLCRREKMLSARAKQTSVVIMRQRQLSHIAANFSKSSNNSEWSTVYLSAIVTSSRQFLLRRSSSCCWTVLRFWLVGNGRVSAYNARRRRIQKRFSSVNTKNTRRFEQGIL